MKQLLFACSQMHQLALKVRDMREAGIELGDISWNLFPDGFPDLKIIEGVRGRDVTFLASFDSPATIFEQLGVLYAIPCSGANSLTLILPYYPTGTMERVQHKGEVATAMTLARMLSAIPHCKGSGMVEIMTFDIHALQEQFYFSDSVLPSLHSAIPLLKARLAELEQGAPKFGIVFPDDGAKKRFGEMFPDREQIICQKVRNGEERIVIIKEGDPNGKRLVMVDDLVMSGGTLIECQKALMAQGAQSVSVFVTHGVFPGDSWERFRTGFSKFWITDSCPVSAAAVAGVHPFEVLSLDESIANIF